MGKTFLIVAAIGLLFVLNAFFPRKDRVLLAPSFMSAWLTIESSPAVYMEQPNIAQVLVGTDVNEQSPAGPAGLVSLKLTADGFQPHWWFDPETGETYDGLAPLQDKNNLTENGCNDGHYG